MPHNLLVLKLFCHAFAPQLAYIGETGDNLDTFIIYRSGADDNRVRDSKQSFKLGMIFVIVKRVFIK